MLKFALKEDRLNFMDGWITNEHAMSLPQSLDNADLLAKLLSGLVTEHTIVDDLVQFMDDGDRGEDNACI